MDKKLDYKFGGIKKTKRSKNEVKSGRKSG